MKKVLLPILSVVLLLHVNKTTAQTSQTPQVSGVQQNTATTQAPAATTSKQVTQPQMSTEQRETEAATRMSKSMESKFALNQKQSHAVYEAYLNLAKEIDAHKSGTPLTKETHDKYVAEKDARIKSILTATQYGKYQAANKVHGSSSPRSNN